jgi:L-cystine uptake protein TcyP (sodium:dicarboxylate symporter family)
LQIFSASFWAQILSFSFCKKKYLKIFCIMIWLFVILFLRRKQVSTRPNYFLVVLCQWIFTTFVSFSSSITLPQSVRIRGDKVDNNDWYQNPKNSNKKTCRYQVSKPFDCSWVFF